MSPIDLAAIAIAAANAAAAAMGQALAEVCQFAKGGTDAGSDSEPEEGFTGSGEQWTGSYPA
jgi:hypothetical protein